MPWPVRLVLLLVARFEPEAAPTVQLVVVLPTAGLGLVLEADFLLDVNRAGDDVPALAADLALPPVLRVEVVVADSGSPDIAVLLSERSEWAVGWSALSTAMQAAL